MVDFLLGMPLSYHPNSVTNSDCQSYAGWLSIAISNFLVLLRIWTTLPRGHRLIIWSMVFFLVMQLVSLAATTLVVMGMIRTLCLPLIFLIALTLNPMKRFSSTSPSSLNAVFLPSRASSASGFPGYRPLPHTFQTPSVTDWSSRLCSRSLYL